MVDRELSRDWPLNRSTQTTDTPDESRLSRGEIETACILLAIGTDACTVEDLPGRLGLSPMLADALTLAISGLVGGGLATNDGGHITLTSCGRDQLASVRPA